MKFLYLSLIIISFFDLAFPQQKTDINNIRTLYQSFDYRGVIQSADSLLTEKNDLDKSDLTEILLMKAVSHYALAEEAQARKCFIDMLKIDRHLELDSEKVSPKIVSLFKEVKNDFLQTIPEEQKITDTRQVNSDPASNELILSKMQDQKNSIVRSFLFPGWGQIYTGNTTKGIIISSAAVLNLGAMIYFIVDANAKQKKYLNATSADIINSSYNSYNRSYITRNVLISSMILIYAYAQVDFLVLGGNGPPEIKLGLGENSSNPGGSGIAFNLKMSL